MLTDHGTVIGVRWRVGESQPCRLEGRDAVGEPLGDVGRDARRPTSRIDEHPVDGRASDLRAIDARAGSRAAPRPAASR